MQIGGRMKKFRSVLLLIGLMGILTACGKEDTVNEMLPEKEYTKEELQELALSEEDAKQLVSEQLEGKKCEYVSDGKVEIGDDNYLVFHITQDGKELKQGLAVQNLSGEIFAYDFDTKKVADYTTFELYDEETDKEYSWDGSYVNDKTRLELLPIDDSSFELHIYQNEKEVFTSNGRQAGNTATCEGEEVTIELIMKDGELQVEDAKGKSGFAGTYVIE
jgi:hypothetical protein